MRERAIDINTFSSWEDLERFCEVQGFDLVWENEILIITERV